MDEAEKTRIHTELEKSLVKIFIGKRIFKGTGFYISNKGHVLTAYHCIGDYPPDIWVESPTQGLFKATLLAQLRHHKLDIAVLETHHSVPHYVPLGFISENVENKEIVALGFPDKRFRLVSGKILTAEEQRFRNNVTLGTGQSGGLIYHYESKRVIGVTIQADTNQPNEGLATRFEPLFKYWSDLKEINERTVKIWENRRDWTQALPNYYDYLIKNYGTLKPLGKSKPMPLQDIFTDVYILNAPLAYHRYATTEEQRRDWSQLQAWEQERTEQLRQNGVELVKEKPRLFILGKPGAGKTTFLKYLTIQQASTQPLGEKIPLFIALKAWADSQQELVDFIKQPFEHVHFPDPTLYLEHILETGTALVLFDGLDEVSQTEIQDRKLVQTLKTFIQRYDDSQYLITCRVAANQYSQVFDRFTFVEIADFTSEQMTTFVGHWFQGHPAQSKQLLKEFAQHPGLADMGRNPLLLSLLCLNFEGQGQLASNRAEIYEQALDVLLRRWDEERAIWRDAIQLDAVYQQLWVVSKKRLLAFLAYETFKQSQYLMPERELQRKIEQFWKNLSAQTAYLDERLGKIILKAIEAQHGILVERTQGYYSFAHLTFQEYFTAEYIVKNRQFSELSAQVTDKRWREVFLLTASLVSAQDGLRFFADFKQALWQLIAQETELVQL